MKILLTSQSSAFGGVEKRLESEAAVFEEMGWETIIATPDFHGKKTWQARLERRGCSFAEWNPYKFIERNHLFLSAKFPFKSSRKMLNRIAPDMAHVALPWTTVGMSRVAELSRMNVPVTLGLHCTYPPQSFSSELSMHIKAALDGVVAAYAVSDSVRKSFLKNFAGMVDHFEVDVIHNGIPCENYSRDNSGVGISRGDLGFGDSDFLIVFCGRLDAMKRPEMAVRLIAHHLLNEMPLKIIFLGDGPLQKDLRELVLQLNVEEKVKFLGFRENTWEIFNIADAYISTSNESEGSSLSASEALASGLPSILSKTPVFLECFDKCVAVSFFDANSVDDCALKLLQLFEKSRAELNRLGCEARKFARNNLDRSRMLKNLQLFYKKTAELI